MMSPKYQLIIKFSILAFCSLSCFYLGYVFHFQNKVNSLAYLNQADYQLSTQEIAYNILQESDIFAIDFITLAALEALKEKTGLPEETLYKKAHLIANNFKQKYPQKSQQLNRQYLWNAAKSLLEHGRNELLIYYNFLKRPTVSHINKKLRNYVQLNQQDDLFKLKIELEELILKDLHKATEETLSKEEREEINRNFLQRSSVF